MDANDRAKIISGSIQKCIHQGPRPSLQRHSTWTKLTSDSILQHQGSQHSKAAPQHQPQQGWQAGRSSLPYARSWRKRSPLC